MRKHNMVPYRDCARLNLPSFNRLASSSRILICYKCSSKKISHFSFHYSQLYLTVSISFDGLSDTNFTFEIDSLAQPLLLYLEFTEPRL